MKLFIFGDKEIICGYLWIHSIWDHVLKGLNIVLLNPVIYGSPEEIMPFDVEIFGLENCWVFWDIRFCFFTRWDSCDCFLVRFPIEIKLSPNFRHWLMCVNGVIPFLFVCMVFWEGFWVVPFTFCGLISACKRTVFEGTSHFYKGWEVGGVIW